MTRDQHERSTGFLGHQLDRRTLLRRSMIASVAVPIAATGLSLDQALAAQAPAATPGASRADGTPAPDDKQVLRVVSTAPFRMDPVTNAAGMWSLQSVVFMALGRVDATNKIVPGVADSWTANADKSEWTFKLNPKAAFSDGTPITADDVKWTFEWIANPKAKANGANNLSTITGYDAVSKGTATTLDGIAVVDPQTITFKLTGPDPIFLAKAAVYSLGILKKDNVVSGGEEWWRKPVTSGMFKVTEYTPGDSGSMTLERNEHWWRDPAKLAKINYKVVSDTQTQLVMYDNGEVDAIPAGAAEFAQAVKPGGQRHDDLVWLPADSTYYFGFFCNKAPFDDVKVRQAFASAIDRQTLAQAIFGGMYPPQGRILSSRFPCGGGQQFQPVFDVAKAKELLAASSYGGPDKVPPTTILVSEPANATAPGIWSRAAEAIQQQLQENLGVKVSVVRKVYGSLAEQQQEAAGIQGGVMFRLSFGVGIYDPSYFTSVVHTGATPTTPNALQYSNPEVDKLLDDAAKETDETKRCEMYQQIDQTVSEAAVFAAPFRGAALGFYKPNVRGIQTVLSGLDASVDKMYIAE